LIGYEHITSFVYFISSKYNKQQEGKGFSPLDGYSTFSLPPSDIFCASTLSLLSNSSRDFLISFAPRLLQKLSQLGLVGGDQVGSGETKAYSNN
jgi:hypothetical protein